MKRLVYFRGIIFVFFLFSCSHDRLHIDVSSVHIPSVEINRMEKDLFEADPNSLIARTPELMKKYGSFYPLFITKIINNGGIRDSSYAYNLKRFLSDKDMRSAYNDCIKSYPDLNFLNQPLTEAFRHYHYYFPEKNIPKIVSYMSGFNYAIATDDSTDGIGLEMYLGSENPFYTMTQFPRYKIMTMRRAYILPDCIRGWLSNTFENDVEKNDFLDEITYQGKILYLTDAILPDVHDTLKIGYTAKQLMWCKQNEFNIWSYFIRNKMLYSRDFNENTKFTHEGPFTSTFSKESPARTGYWMGWQIVRMYMDKNPEITVPQLAEEKDAQKILTQSKYKPEGQ